MYEEAARESLANMTWLTKADSLLRVVYLDQARKADELLATEGKVGILNVRELRMLDSELRKRKGNESKDMDQELQELIDSM